MSDDYIVKIDIKPGSADFISRAFLYAILTSSDAKRYAYTLLETYIADWLTMWIYDPFKEEYLPPSKARSYLENIPVSKLKEHMEELKDQIVMDIILKDKVYSIDNHFRIAEIEYDTRQFEEEVRERLDKEKEEEK